MGIFRHPPAAEPPHPRQEPRFSGSLTPDALAAVFGGSADLGRRRVLLGGDPSRPAELLYLGGLVRLERVGDYLLRPLATDLRLARGTPRETFARLLSGGAYTLSAKAAASLDEAALGLTDGSCALFIPGVEGRALLFSAATEEKRSISPSDSEPPLKSARDSFVESLRTNTSLVRRRLKTPELRVRETVAGRQSLTPVDVLWLSDVADPALAEAVFRQVEEMDIDAVVAAGSLEEYLIPGAPRTAFPLANHTERPDRFAAALAEGRVGVLCEGLPLGFLLPGTCGEFLRAPEDRAEGPYLASVLRCVRYLCLLISLFLPAVYIAAVAFHPEMVPARLAEAILQARHDVPFTSLSEALVMLLAFEAVQEAGLRLPAAVGQTVSILGGLVVGTAAVDAHIVSPAVLIVVAIAGVAGYTVPDQDLAGALRIWRFLLTVCAGVGGLFGVAMGTAVLLGRLGRLESFGIPWLAPFAGPPAEPGARRGILRRPLPEVKLRESMLHPVNRRNQR